MTSPVSTGVSYTPTVIASQLVSYLNADQSQQATLETQLSSGNLVNQPSDNPAAASTILAANSSLSRAQEYSSNASDASAWLSLGTSTLNSVISALQSAQQSVMALSGNALSNSQAAVQGTAATLQSVLSQVTALANTTYGNQAIFAGTGNVSVAYDASGNYVGGGSAPTRTVGPGVSVAIAATGPAVFGSGSSGLLGSTGILSKLISDVTAGTPASIATATTTDVAALNSAIQNVTSQAGVLGATYQSVQTFAAQATNVQTALQTQMSAVDSVNIAQATTALTQSQNTYQAGLWATAQIEQHSLVTYL
ncbi:MAG: flagellin [Acidimicrobiales bacterium]